MSSGSVDLATGARATERGQYFEREGKAPAVAQATKTGMLFVFDRETGEPVFEIVERPASN